MKCVTRSFSQKTGRGAKKDHGGERFGRLIAISFAYFKNRKTYWNFKCDCGNSVTKQIESVKSGGSVSCGCYIKEYLSRDKVEMIGKRFGRLVVESKSENRADGERKWNCLCDCGSRHVSTGTALRCGDSKSCGCLQREKASVQAKSMGDANKTHGMTNSREFNVWKSVVARCSCETTPSYRYYGGRGIRYCERWESFENFYEDMGPRPEGKTCDRINVNGHYSCGKCEQCSREGWTANCRWATDIEQQRNRSSGHRRITFNGETKLLTEWAESTGLPIGMIHTRLKTGWPLELALTLPAGSRPSLPEVKDRDIDESWKRQIKAGADLNTAVKSGRVIKPKCCSVDWCDETKIEAHHHKGYAPEHALDVRWLCKRHHEEAEKLMPKELKA